VDPFASHAVVNQPPPLPDHDAYATDPALREAVAQMDGGWGTDRLHAYGVLAGGELRSLGEDANRFPPRLRSHDRFGHRIDQVEFHPAWHRLMSLAMAHGLHALPWQLPQPGAHVVRAALEYLHHQAEAGSNCPLTMTHAAMPVLRQGGERLAGWRSALVGERYDARDVPVAEKSAITLGMGMTEKQGGSDVRANSSRAEAQADGSVLLTGHKWFLSAPASDGFLVLAQGDAGLGCYLMPRLLDDGTRNNLRLQRLKDKLGNHANASSEVEFVQALAWPVGAPGRGIATILEMVALTRLDCMIGSAALMRQALVQAVHHCRHRHAFGRRLAEQPLMANVLADLALESEAALWLALRTAQAIDRAGSDPREAALARVLTPVGKYWICRRAPAVVNEAQECLGGGGYVEESILPRLYREAPLNSIWEGCGNIQCLDLLRALAREPTCVDALRAELALAAGADRTYDAAVAAIERRLLAGDTDEGGSRLLAERLALLLQTGLLLRHAPSALSGAFCRSRLGGEHGKALGTLPAGVAFDSVVQRASANG
jgi:putative acyl-CoA dehydrogenase